MGNWTTICFSHYLTRTLFQNPLADLANYRFDDMRGKARDILILQRITDLSTTGSAWLKRRYNEWKIYIHSITLMKSIVKVYIHLIKLMKSIVKVYIHFIILLKSIVQVYIHLIKLMNIISACNWNSNLSTPLVSILRLYVTEIVIPQLD